jgi:hypothetical protein
MPVTELRRAFDEGDVAGARELLLADPSLTTALIDAPDIEPTSPLTYLGMARFYGYANHDRTGDLARALIDAGADKDDEAKNGSPLVCAASHGDPVVVRALLDAGANVELADSPPDTALRLAAAFGYPEIVDRLIAAGGADQFRHRGGRRWRPHRVAHRRAVGLRPSVRFGRRPSTNGSGSSTSCSLPALPSMPRSTALQPSIGRPSKVGNEPSPTC